ncbi:LamB/YcsF family protein [Marinifilum caeruleilacunae]|uniref:5-oxoprolinase subunit A n=1 Tax=Marinifilum caeruleilacunae TaxID=2499076 RepID=A0ABX1WRW8_9BACT|nr:5-oxoprolinase subunit PxpA [Marinifilum caeruleilacunae]NOU58818.1 5-oxoprolinase subunit PxpA [Marinifilum caeruleilacunae]
MIRIDLNSDLGESFGNYKIGMDEELMKYISSANIACGYHAGDPLIMEKTIRMALKHGVAIGAHPGYPDLIGFGRRNMSVSLEELKTMVKYQVSALKGMTESLGGKLQHVKPHGAMYNQAAANLDMAIAIAEGIKEIDPNLIFMGLANSCMQEAADSVGLIFASEIFADRAYTDEGKLVPRSREGAVIHEPDMVCERVLEMVKHGKVKSINRKEVALKADTICIHGDNPAAFELAVRIYECLAENEIQIRALR